MYAVIIAGGYGTRFWPWSRRTRPKQFLPITGKQPMLRETVERLFPLLSWNEVFVITGESLRDRVAEALPELPSGQLIIEPEGRNTAPAIGFATLHVLQRDPNAIIAFLPSDHHIPDKESFQKTLAVAENVARADGYIATIGIPPTYPETGYGYLHYDTTERIVDGSIVYPVIEFKEKPDAENAACFFKRKDYFWNAGMFIAQGKTFLNAFQIHMPSDYQILTQLQQLINQDASRESINHLFVKLTEKSIDYGIMQYYSPIIAVPGSFKWNDVGSFRALYDLRESDANGNIINGDVVCDSVSNALVHSHNRTIAMIGVKDIVVVDTGDVILVCHKDKTQHISDMVKKLNDDANHKHLL